MPTYVTKAIPLRTQPLGNADMFAVLLTEEKGRARVVVRGGRKALGKLAAPLCAIAEVEVMIAKGSRLDILAGIRTVRQFSALSRSLRKRLVVSSLYDVLGRIVPEQEQAAPAYAFVRSFLQFLDGLPEPRHGAGGVSIPKMWFVLSLWRVFGILGYAPHIDSCVTCKRALDKDAAAFSVPVGGMVCARCLPGQPGVFRLSLPARQLLQGIARSSSDREVFEKIERACFNFSEHQALHLLISRYGEYILETELGGMRVYGEVMDHISV